MCVDKEGSLVSLPNDHLEPLDEAESTLSVVRGRFGMAGRTRSGLEGGLFEVTGRGRWGGVAQTFLGGSPDLPDCLCLPSQGGRLTFLAIHCGEFKTKVESARGRALGPYCPPLFD